MKRALLLGALALASVGCADDEDWCRGRDTSAIDNGPVTLVVTNGTTQTTASGWTAVLACPGLPDVTFHESSNHQPLMHFGNGPRNSSLTCTLTVTAPGYAPWKQDLPQTYGPCGYAMQGYRLEVQLQPAM